MPNTNPRNFGIAIGRLGRDPKFFDNRDGSKKVLMSLAVRQNFKSADGTRGVDWVDLEAFIPANAGVGVYGLLHKGIKIQAMYSVSTSTYTDSNGEAQRKQVLRITNIELLDAPKNGVQAAAPVPAEAVGPVSAMPGSDDEFDA